MDQKVVQKIGKYEIVSELGQGGMGIVYKARDPFIGRMVALKTITPELVSDPEILKRFYREAQSAGTLQHPNIVTIYDLGEADGRPYIAMEFVEGESLQGIINRRARIPLAAKLKLVQQFCEGLDHAHKHGFVHRDVKPANILVTNDGVVKVVDFGIVHLESTNLTKTGMFLGTIHYASPEQINDGRVDSRSDLWSVTCVVYEFIAYKKAFDGSNIAAIIAKVLSAEPEPLSRCCPGVPAELDTVISKGLKKNIEERYQSLDEMLGGLLPIARGLQQSFIGDLLQEAKDLRDKGDFNGAQEKVRAVLILDNTHADGKRLYSEVAADLHRVAPAAKAKKLVGEAEQAFSRGEYAEAIRILGEAQELNPTDTQARNLKDKALREQDRVRELSEALSSGQRAWKQGDLTGAEQELHRVLQLDQNNPKAAELLEQIRQDRLSRERDFRLKEALWEADNLVSGGKYEEAQNRLLELQQDFPSSDEIHLKLQTLDPLVRGRKLVQDGANAFNQGEYAEAVRALTEALELNPQDNEARDLKERALQERDRLRQVREALSSGQRAMRQGDVIAAERELQRVLQLDPTNTQASSLLGQIRQAQAAREREEQFRQALQQSDNLVAEGKFDDAQHALLELQQEFPDSTEIDQKLLALDQQMKLGRLLAGGQQAFDQGEFGEAVRILTEAQELAPSDARVRDLKVRAVQQRDLLRQVREAISAGQRATRQGDAGAAAREYQRALQLDPTNAQAKSLLAQVEKDRQVREAEQRLKEGLSQAEKLLSRKKFDEAQRKLLELQQSYPDSEEVRQKLQALSQRMVKPAAPAPPPAPSAAAETAPLQGGPLNEAAKSMQYAEELRRSLETPRMAEPAPPAKLPAPELTPTIPMAQAPAQATRVSEAPQAEPASDAHGATFMMQSFKGQAEAGQKALEVPPPPPLHPPQVQAPPPPPAPPRVEPKKPAPAPAPPRVTPAPPVMARKEAPKKSPMIMVAAIVLVVILAVGGYLIFHHAPTPPPGPSNLTATQEELTAKDQATQFESQHKLKDALNEWGEVQAKHGALANDASDAIARIQKEQASAQGLFDQGKTQEAQAQGSKDLLKKAIDPYQQAEQADDDLKAEAEARIAHINDVIRGEDPAKGAFGRGQSAFTAKNYKQAISEFQSVVKDNPESNLVPKAQAMLGRAEAALRDQDKFDDAVNKYKAGRVAEAKPIFQELDSRPNDHRSEAHDYLTKMSTPPTATLTADATTVEKGSSVTLKWSSQNATELNLEPGLGKVAAEGSKSVTLQDSTTYTLTATGPGGTKNVSTSVSVKSAPPPPPPPAPVTATLTANPTTVEKGKSVTLSWSSKNATDLDLEPGLGKVPAEGSKSVAPQETTTYTLIATGPGGKQIPTVSVSVSAPTTTTTTTTPPPPPPNPTHNPVVTPLPSGALRPLNLPYHKGMLVADVNVDGGLKPTNLAMPPVQGAPPGTFVLIMIKIDENGGVTVDRVLTDTSGSGQQVQEAARAWKFNPPTAKGKPVNTTLSVKVTF